MCSLLFNWFIFCFGAKVSYAQFDSACGDLTRCIDQTTKKLVEHECTWSRLIEEMQRDIQGKVDKEEIPPIKDFVDDKLKGLQDKLTKLCKPTAENEAAGTKKLLR